MHKPQTCSIAAPTYLQALSLFRILIGLLLIAYVAQNILPYIPDLYYANGFLPNAVVAATEHRAGYVSLLNFTENPWVIDLFFVVYGAALFALVIGYRTRIALWITFLAHSSIAYRTPIMTIGTETIMRLLLLWSLFLPLNRYWSIDAALSKQSREVEVPWLLMTGIRLQICWLYLFAALFKLYGPAWCQGEAINLALQDTRFTSYLGELFRENFHFLLYPLTYAVIGFQLLFIPLVYAPFKQAALRILAIGAAILMHLSFALLLNVGYFPAICLVYLCLLVSDTTWNKFFLKRRARLQNIETYFDPNCIFCEKTCLILREFCLSPFSNVYPANRDPEIYKLFTLHNSWVVRDGKNGQIYLKWKAVSFILRQSFLFWPLGVLTDLPGLITFFDHFYDWIGKRRTQLSALTSWMLPYRTIPYAPGPFAKVLCGVLMGISLIGNILSLPTFYTNPSIPNVLWDIITVSQTYQRWNLFVPAPASQAYDYALSGTTRSGEMVDLRPALDQNRFDFSDLQHLKFRSFRWLWYFTRLYDPIYRPVVGQLLQTIAARYNGQTEHLNDPLIHVAVQLKRQSYKQFQEGRPFYTEVDMVWKVGDPLILQPAVPVPNR